jgi:parafibromin
MSSMSSTTTDPLSALRQAIKSKTPITYANETTPCPTLLLATHIVLDGTPFPKSSPTRYRKPSVSDTSEPSLAPQDFFSLNAVYLAWLLRDAPGAEYMKQARENGLTLGFVSVTERKIVVEWLEGKIPDHDRIFTLHG